MKIVEKITHAIYLASRHLKDNEPLKWELRKDSIALLACSRTLEGQNSLSSEIPVDLASEAFLSCARDLISLLSLSLVAGLMARNNVNLIIRELEITINGIDKEVQDGGPKDGFVLSEDFFRELDKGGPALPKKEANNVKNSRGKEADIKDKKDSRVTRILSILKDQPSSTIKDFARIIVDCSEKTIQRELTDLVGKGIVKKEGQRRWSRYSLK